MSAHFEEEIHIDSDDERTLPHDGETDGEAHSEVDERQMPQQRQLKPRRWMSEIEWTNYVQGDPSVRLRPASVVSIFRVPKFLKHTKEEAYVPQRISLGPHHHGSAELPEMGHHKGRALRRMSVRRMSVDPNYMDFANRAMEEILKLEKEIRDSYEENIDCDGETLARILCLDGCFLLEVLRTLRVEALRTLRTLAGDKVSRAEVAECYDPIFGEDNIIYAAKDVLYDILILENQIPLIILRKLLELELHSAVDAQEHLNALMQIISAAFNPFDDKNIDTEQCSSWPEPGEQRVHHLLGFLHTVIAPPPSSRQRECVDEGKRSIPIDCCSSQCIRLLRGKKRAGDEVAMIPHAVELRNAGIKFKPLQGGCIKEIKFDQNSATILLPPISIMDHTERVFRNLIAYEMCKPSEINYVSCYVALMDNLIDSEEDVALLRRMGVVSNWLGSDKEVANLFNGLGNEVTLSPASMEAVFDKLTEKVSDHYRNKLKVQVAELVRDHFSSPWKALALAAATLMLVFTIVQTVYTIKKK